MKLAELKLRMQELEVRSKRSLGQNFLVSEFVIEEIIDAVKKAKPKFVIEIGPGLGALTEGLKDFKPLLIELDRDLANHWREAGGNVLEGDALKIKWAEIEIPDNTWLVSNLPYQISTHLVVDRCFGPEAIKGMILMFQKEVAQRLTATARSDEYGFLSVIAQTYWTMSKLVDAAPRDFYPAPKVASRVLVFKRKAPDLDRGFLTFVKAAFAQRRKFLLKNLKALGHKKSATFEQIFEEKKINLKARAEELTPLQFAELYRHWKEK